MVDPVLQAMVNEPIGSREVQAQICFHQGEWVGPPAAKEAARRAKKIWLPEGKRPANGDDERRRREEFAARQVDLEEAVEAAGGARGSLRS